MTSLDNQWRHAPGLGLAPGARWSDLMAAEPTPPGDTARILAVADQLDGTDADSAFVADQMRAAVTAPTTGWLAHAIERWFG
jgi:hypothetical protein